MKQKSLNTEAKPEEIKFKVFRVMRKSNRRTILAKNLSEADAKKLVNSFPDSDKSMVCFARQ
jgi:hypothetical protein